MVTEPNGDKNLVNLFIGPEIEKQMEATKYYKDLYGNLPTKFDILGSEGFTGKVRSRAIIFDGSRWRIFTLNDLFRAFKNSFVAENPPK